MPVSCYPSYSASTPSKTAPNRKESVRPKTCGTHYQALALPGSLLEMQNCRLHPRHAESETLGDSFAHESLRLIEDILIFI